MRIETIKLGRIVIRSWENIDFKSIMLKVLSGRKPYKSKVYLFHFNNERLLFDDVVYGEIFKTHLHSQHKELISEHQLAYDETVIDELYEYNRFCIFPDHSIIMSSKSKFNSDEFINVFRHLFNLNYAEFVQFAVHYRRDDYDIFQIIDRFDKMLEVEIKKVGKSNPDPTPTFDKIERFFEEEKVDEYSADFKADEGSEGLSRDRGGHIMSAISLTDSGYGDSKIVGVKGNEYITIRSRDKILQTTIEKVDMENVEEYIRKAWHKFRAHINYKLRR